MSETVFSQASPGLAQLFGAALQRVAAQREEINALDGYNGNHGDNMVQNLQVITDALTVQGDKPPAEALRYAGQALQVQGRGGTSQFYSQGLGQAAEKLQGHTALEQGDVMTLIQSLLGAVPAAANPQEGQTVQSVLDMVLGMAGMGGAQEAQPAPAPEPEPTLGGGVMDMLKGLIGLSPAPAPTPQPSVVPQDDGFDMGDVLERLLPAGLAYLQAKQAGADSSQAIQQALAKALLGGQTQSASTPRAAAGSLIAQSMLQAFLGRK
ncbi:MAG: DAK2 domain-containing protein [Anaerolineae bacterium]|nr:DAK2 domain-containing protein [Anaerolineae bacterium]